MKTKISYSQFVFTLLIFSTLFVLIYNIFYFNPILGYDAEAHYNYVDYLARYLPNELRLPSVDDTREYFNPPLGYLVPATAQIICRNIIESNNFLSDCQPIYGKSAQVFQSILYVITIFINLYTLKLFNNSKSIINVGYLLLVSLLAVNYRTISMIRGEPYILFFLSLFLLIIYKAENNNNQFDLKLIFSAGVVIGCIALSRQWGFFLFLPVIILLFYKKPKKDYFVFWLTSSVLGFMFSGWFYLGLYKKYGTFTPFNMQSSSLSLSNQDLTFYVPNIVQLEYLFSKPIRPNLNNQFFSILYSDLWGDYWGYFTFTSRFLANGRNQLSIGDYLARTNLVSVISTLIIIRFCFLTYRKNKSNFLIRYIYFAIFISLFGYMIFAILYPTSSGDTIKATYIIQAFHLIVFLASISFYNLEKINKKSYNLILTILTIIYFYNFQTYLSHFPYNFFP